MTLSKCNDGVKETKLIIIGVVSVQSAALGELFCVGLEAVTIDKRPEDEGLIEGYVDPSVDCRCR